MARFAPVVPLPVAKVMKAAGILGTYHLLLAHDVLAHPKEYKEVYGDLSDNATIILDNSIIELGEAMQLEELLKASQIIRPKYLVIPDAMGDADETVARAREFTSEYASRIYDVLQSPGLLAVVHGRTMKEFRQCAEDVAGLPAVCALSAPRIVTALQSSRTEATLYLLRYYYITHQIHLLGFSDNILDDVCCARLPGVMGIDSAVPIRAAMKEIEIRLSTTWDCGPRGNFWEETEESATLYIDLIAHNVRRYRSWIGDIP